MNAYLSMPLFAAFALVVSCDASVVAAETRVYSVSDVLGEAPAEGDRAARERLAKKQAALQELIAAALKKAGLDQSPPSMSFSDGALEAKADPAQHDVIAETISRVFQSVTRVYALGGVPGDSADKDGQAKKQKALQDRITEAMKKAGLNEFQPSLTFAENALVAKTSAEQHELIAKTIEEYTRNEPTKVK